MDAAEAIDRARRLQEEGRESEALEILLAAAAGNPHEDLDIELAYLYTERGLRAPDEAALKSFEEAKGWYELPLTLAAESRVRARRKEFDPAESLLARALELDPELPEALLARGQLLLARGDFDPAVAALADVLERDPAHPAPYLLLAEALAGAGRKEDGRHALRAGLAHAPRNVGLLLASARAEAEAGDEASACRAWRLASEVDRGSAEAWRGVAWCAARNREELEMHAALDRAMEFDAEGTRAWLEKESSGVPLLRTYAP